MRSSGYPVSGRLIVLSLMVSCSFCGEAWAQSAKVSPSAPDEPAEERAIGDIVVTAQRREERLQTVPVTVTAFDSKTLVAAGIDSVRDLPQVTPGLNFAQLYYSPQPTLRGIGTRGVTAGDESTVPIYIDGAYQPFLSGQDLELGDIQRVEVLKGPQGALFGRNAMGGALNVTTRIPTSKLTGAFDVSYGRFDETIARGYLAGGVEGLAVSLAAAKTDSDGYVRDLSRGRAVGGRDELSARTRISINEGGKIEFLLSANYTNNFASTGEALRALNGNTIGARIPNNPVGIKDYTVNLTFQPANDFRQYGTSAKVTVHLGAVDLTSVTSFQSNRLNFLVDSDFSAAELSSLHYVIKSRSVYHETYLLSRWSGPLSVTAGGVYYHDYSYYPLYQLRSNNVISVDINPNVYTTSFAGYAQARFDFSDKVSLVAAGRYTSEKRSVSTVNNLANTRFRNAANYSRTTPSVTLQFTPSSSLNAYAKYGQAFKSGLFTASATSLAALQPVKQEVLTQYEVGLKTDPLPWFRVNVAGYFSDYRNLQVTSRLPNGLALLQNAAAAHIYGLEVETLIRPVSRLTVRAGLSAIRGKLRDFTNAAVTIPATTNDPVPGTRCAYGNGTLVGGNRSVVCDASGNSIVNTPFVTANLGADYSIPAGAGEIAASGNLYYAGHSYWDALNRLREPVKVLLNAELSWKPGPGDIRFALWGANLFNERYSASLVTASTGDGQVLAQPRTYGVRARYNF